MITQIRPLLATIFLLFSWPLASSELVVRLSTEKALLPVSLKLECSDGSISKGYADSLFKILQFDLAHNGMTEVVELPASAAGQKMGVDAYREMRITYAIEARVEHKKLQCRLISTAQETADVIENMPLTGHIAEDRQLIHQLHDSLHQKMFDHPGIASTRILYTVRERKVPHDARTWTAEVYECDSDGANIRKLTSEGSYAVTPTYIPPKKGGRPGSFFYVSYRLGQPKIFVASLKDGIGRRLSYLRGNQLMPAINASGSQVALVSDVTGSTDLFLLSFSKEAGVIGKPRQIFSKLNSSQASPCFSPDGSQLAFVSDKDGSPKIYLLPLVPGGKPVLLTKRNRESTAPSWSPDGSKIAFTALTQGVRQIWVVDLATGTETQLTQGAGDKENPSFAPNGLHLVYNQAEGTHRAELYIIDLKRLKPFKISDGKGEKRFPCWEMR
ncbi:MAG: tolB [Chlamydiales bacterium]|jgi:TolB protein|nr:tolB [Chlamydiales bacterium]